LTVWRFPHLNKLRRTMNDFLAMKKRKNTTPGPMPRRRYPKKAVAAMMRKLQPTQAPSAAFCCSYMSDAIAVDCLCHAVTASS
jgi:hypothetical protein